MSVDLKIFEEPLLEFRYGQKLQDPHDGLSLFGPFDTDTNYHPRNITYGLIGTEKGVNNFLKFSERINHSINPGDEGLNKRLWPPYPGFEAIFHSKWPNKPAKTYLLDEKEIIESSRHRDPNIRAYNIVNRYMENISTVSTKRDETFHILICVVPDEVWKNCRPKSIVTDAWGNSIDKKTRKERAEGQKSIFHWSQQKDDWNTEQYQLSVDFRRQLKARIMKYKIPIQIIRESTLSLDHFEDEERNVTTLSDRAWNLSTAIYYKAGGKPWRLSTARDGVCYIGISFRRIDNEMDNRTACCAAQMFLDSGDGVVFLGDEGKFYSPTDKQCHLNKESAKRLLSGVLETYHGLDGKELKEIFLHSRSTINNEEFKGYQEACPNGVKIVGIRVKLDYDGMRLYREGTRAVLRGSFLRWDDKTAYLWGSGFKPRLASYDGHQVPIPLKIVIEHGNSLIEQVSYDILGLTKLNYNACKLGDNEPVTIGFSDAVGEILVSNPIVKESDPKFKFYI